MKPEGWADAPSMPLGVTTLTQAVKYAGASGDFNPLHYDPQVARRAGFDDIIVHGSLNAARLAHVLESGLSPARSTDTSASRTDIGKLTELMVRFERPVKLGQALAVAWRETAKSTELILYCEDSGEKAVGAEARYGDISYSIDGPPDLRHVSDPYRWPVEAGAVRSFAEAVTGERLIVEDNIPVSLAFIGTCIRWTAATQSVVRRLGFDMNRMLHGSSWFQVFAAPIRIGEVLFVSEGHGNLMERPHKSGGVMRFGDAILDIHDADGTRRARMVQRLIERPGKQK